MRANACPGRLALLIGVALAAPAHGQSVAPSLDSGGTAKRTLSVTDFGAKGDGSADDSLAFNAAFRLAATVNGAVYVPPSPRFYRVDSTIVVPQNASLICADGAQIRPGAPMSDLIAITANMNSLLHGRCILSNQSNFAKNGVAFRPLVPGNNANTVKEFTVFGFENNYYNYNSDTFYLINDYSQNATGWDVKSEDNGTGSHIDQLLTLGSAGGIFYDHHGVFPSIEGVRITNSQILANRGNHGSIVFNGDLALVIDNDLIDQAHGHCIELNGDTGYGSSDTQITNTWCGSDEATIGVGYGVYAHGNVNNLYLRGDSFAQWRAGVFLRSTASGSIQQVNVESSWFLENRYADVMTDTDYAGVGVVLGSLNHFNSTGNGVVPLSLGAATIGLFTKNYFAVTPQWIASVQHADNFGDDLSPSTGRYAPWKSYVPAVSCANGGPPTGVRTGRYYRTANLVFFQADVTLAALNGCTGNVTIALPQTVGGADSVVAGRESRNTGQMLQGHAYAGTTQLIIQTVGGEPRNALNDQFVMSGSYEAAP